MNTVPVQTCALTERARAMKWPSLASQGVGWGGITITDSGQIVASFLVRFGVNLVPRNPWYLLLILLFNQRVFPRLFAEDFTPEPTTSPTTRGPPVFTFPF